MFNRNLSRADSKHLARTLAAAGVMALVNLALAGAPPVVSSPPAEPADPEPVNPAPQPLPTNTLPPRSVTALAGGGILLDAFPNAEVVADFSWWRDGVLLHDNSHYAGTTSQQLRINSATVGDTAHYEVRWSDDGGNWSAMIKLTVAARTCVADIAGPNDSLVPDGQLTADDLVAFMNAFEAGDTLADITGIGGGTGPDGLVTGDDFNAFINAFITGCP